MKYVLGLLLAACLSVGARAENFVYTGFYDEQAAEWIPWMTVSGYFTSQDTNGDGVHERDEVTAMVINGHPFVGGCGDASICGLFRFSYVPGQSLDIQAGYGMLDSETNEAWANWEFDSGVGLHSSWQGVGGWHNSTLSWRPETTLQISGVPEPETYAMLGVGLALLGVSRRLRRQRSAPPSRRARRSLFR